MDLDSSAAKEDRVFSVETPSAFFSMYGALGGSVSRDLAMEAFYDDLAVTGRTVSLEAKRTTLPGVTNTVDS